MALRVCSLVNPSIADVHGACRPAPPPPFLPLPAGVESFINTFHNVTTVELDGLTIRLATPAESYGLSLAGMSALHVSGFTGRGRWLLAGAALPVPPRP